MTRAPAARADRMPGVASSIAIERAGAAPSRRQPVAVGLGRRLAVRVVLGGHHHREQIAGRRCPRARRATSPRLAPDTTASFDRPRQPLARARPRPAARDSPVAAISARFSSTAAAMSSCIATVERVVARDHRVDLVPGVPDRRSRARRRAARRRSAAPRARPIRRSRARCRPACRRDRTASRRARPAVSGWRVLTRGFYRGTLRGSGVNYPGSDHPDQDLAHRRLRGGRGRRRVVGAHVRSPATGSSRTRRPAPRSSPTTSPRI